MGSLSYAKDFLLTGLRNQLTEASCSPVQGRVDHPVSPPPFPATPPPFLTRPWSSICSKGSSMVKLVKNYGCRLTCWNESIKRSPRMSPRLVQRPAIVADKCDVGRVAIDMLPDDVLLDIFDFYLDEARPTFGGFEAWFTLAHVCWRWRNVVFASPHRLGLQLVCTARSPVKEKLDILPAFPIVISQYALGLEGIHNIAAALKHTDRVCGIDLHLASYWVLDDVFAEMQQSFPALKYLYLVTNIGSGIRKKIPDSFLGGSAPHLRSLQLGGFEYRGLSNLLSSATGLVFLSLWNIPHFLLPPSSTRLVFPALTRFEFKGYKRYLEDFVAQVDTPILDDLCITLSDHDTSGFPRLSSFINCPLNLKAPNNALIIFWSNTFSVKFRLPSGYETLKLKFESKITSYGPDPDSSLSSLARICGSCLPSLPTVERLYVRFASLNGQYVQDTQWLGLLDPFTFLERLYLSEELQAAPVRRGAIKVLPTPQDIFSESQLQEAIPRPFTPRQLFSYHIVRELDASERPPVTGAMPPMNLPFIPHANQL
jgi:hypothetical protein